MNTSGPAKITESEDSLFEESVLNSSFSPEITTIHNEYNDYMQEIGDKVFTDSFDIEEEDIDYHPGDLVNLRGLFDEDAVDPSNNSTTLDFDEIPDDIDIDEPIEVEELSRAGQIMNVVVKASLIIFGLIVLGFIINAGLVVGAVLSTNFQSRVFIDVSDLDKKIAKINATIMTETTNFGSFIEGELDPVEPVKAFVYLSNEEVAQHHDAICEIEYNPPSEKEKIIKFNGGVRNVFHLQDISLKLNPNFDASRLSGFMEPKDGDKFHERYPRYLIIYFSASLRITSFWVPIPYQIKMFTKVDMTKTDPVLEKKKLEKMRKFDFNPKFVNLSSPNNEKLAMKIRQPVPKFYAPPYYHIAIHMPEIDLVVKQFTNKEPKSSPDIKTLFNNQAKQVVKAKVKPFRMIMCNDDMTPNIVEIEAEVEKANFNGLINVLNAIRDNELNTLAFLFASIKFNPDNQPTPAEPVKDSDRPLKPKLLEGCTLPEFLETFWGRQAYPVGDGTGPPIPSLPETYNPLKDPAINVKFNGIEKEFLKFSISASTHYIISEYKLPLLMLTGELPQMNFKMTVKRENKQIDTAKFIIKHENTNKIDDNGTRPLGSKLDFDVSIEILNLELLSKFALKYSRMEQVKAKGIKNTQNAVGKMFKEIEGAEIVADFDVRSKTWPSKIASVFNMKFNLSREKVELIYSGNGKPIIPENPKDSFVEGDKVKTAKLDKKEPVYSKAEDEALTKSIDDILGIKFQVLYDIKGNAEADSVSNERHDKLIVEKIEELKTKVKEIDAEFVNESKLKENFASKSKIECDEIVKKSKVTVVAKPVSEVVNELDVKGEKLENHEKLVKVRELLKARNALRKLIKLDKRIDQKNLFVKVDSDETEMKVRTAVALNESEKLFDDHVIISWEEFKVALADGEKVRIANVKFENGIFKLFLNDGSIAVVEEEEKANPIKLTAKFGPKKGMDVTIWMESFRNFFDNLMSSKINFASCYLTLKSSDESVTWSSELPTAAVPAIPTSSETDKQATEAAKPDFFGNLSKSHFDFIGYGFYRLIFHAILPNPESCPSGSSIMNVELDLPKTTTFLFVNADTGDLKENTCVASINTARPLRLWTQIIDGVLCNMYAVADGLEEQEMTIHARISNNRSKEIIESFYTVLSLRNSYEIEREIIKNTESPLLKYRTPTKVKIDKVPLNKRLALITAVPVSVEILNFDHLIKIADAFGEKRHVQIGPGDPTITELTTREKPSLFNVITSALAGNFPIDFNTPEQLKKSEIVGPRKVLVNSTDKVVLKVEAKSSSTRELNVNTSIVMSSCLKPKKEIDLASVPYVTYESLKAEIRFQHPIIRWGKTELTFLLPKFKLTLKLSPGDVKVTNEDSKIIFDALKNFEIDFSIKAHSEKKSFKPEKEIFRTSSIRQFFKECQKFIRDAKYRNHLSTEIKTTSVVSYGQNDNQNFHFLGLADTESFFRLQGVIIRRMFAGGAERDESYDPREDPTFIDFGMLISLGGGNSNAEYENIPRLGVPCFFTNFCSAEQLSYSTLNRKGLLSKGNHIPVTLHVGNTFLPLTASIAAGFSTLLPLFSMKTYPKTLEWQLIIPDEQVIGMEMNGLGMFFGKAEPISITRIAEIPYPNFQEVSLPRKGNKTKDNLQKNVKEVILEGNPEFKDRANFDKKFFDISEQEFKDKVEIKVKAQIPDSLPHLLRNNMWSLFFLPMDTMTLHPPLINIEKPTPTELSHAPIAVSLSDSMVYKGSNGKVTKPSLLTKLFTAFVEESSSKGVNMHSLNDNPSPTRIYYTHNLDAMKYYDFLSISNLALKFLRQDDSLIHLVVWMQFPWALGSIGFDFGSNLMGKITLKDQKKTLLLEGYMSRHRMIGEIARIRLDLAIPAPNLSTCISLLTVGSNVLTSRVRDFLASYVSIVGQNQYNDIPLGFEFVVDNNFIAETEMTIPKKLLESQRIPPSSQTKDVNLTPTKRQVDMLLQRYKTIPQAVACVYNLKVDDSEFYKQSYLWTQLDLAMTRVYFPEISGLKPGDELNLFLQLRTVDQVPVCGLFKEIQGLAVMIEYIKPDYPLEILFNNEFSVANPDRIYLEAGFYAFTSVFTIKTRLNFTGRYKVYAALIPSSMKNEAAEINVKLLKNLRYKEIKFTEIYVQHSR